MSMSDLKTRSEAAEYLRISVRTLDRRHKEGRIPCVSGQRYGRVLYRQKDLDSYIKACIRRNAERK